MNKDCIKTDKAGGSYEIGPSDATDFSLLLDMYCAFSPQPASQGLPPLNPEACHNWVKMLFKIGRNYLTWKNGMIVGHAALVPDPNGKSAEFIIFVDQNHRNLGIGTELMRVVLEEAKKLGFMSVWLTVETSNFIAIKLYRNFGFQFRDTDSCERVMCLKFR